MKSFLFFIANVLTALCLQSCSCTECVKYPEETVKLCKKDFASEDAYTQAYKQLSYEGYNCQ